MRGQVGPAVRGNAFSSLLAIAEGSLTVAQLATTDLWFADAAKPAKVAASEMQAFGYDVAPIGDPPNRYVSLEDLLQADGLVGEAARPIDVSLLVTASFALVDGIRLLATRPFYFVPESNRVTGVVTWSDLQRPAVSMVLFSLILATEMALRSMIGAAYGDDFAAHLSPGRRDKLRDVYTSRMLHNTHISMLECLMLVDTLTLIGKRTDLCERLDLPSGKPYWDWANRFENLRNTLAHGGAILDVEPEARRAVDLFSDIRRFAELSWQEAAFSSA